MEPQLPSSAASSQPGENPLFISYGLGKRPPPYPLANAMRKFMQRHSRIRRLFANAMRKFMQRHSRINGLCLHQSTILPRAEKNISVNSSKKS